MLNITPSLAAVIMKIYLVRACMSRRNNKPDHRIND